MVRQGATLLDLARGHANSLDSIPPSCDPYVTMFCVICSTSIQVLLRRMLSSDARCKLHCLQELFTAGAASANQILPKHKQCLVLEVRDSPAEWRMEVITGPTCLCRTRLRLAASSGDAAVCAYSCRSDFSMSRSRSLGCHPHKLASYAIAQCMASACSRRQRKTGPLVQ